MILPTKHIPIDKSAIGSAALVLRALTSPLTVSELWEKVSQSGISTFDQYVMGLTFLNVLGIIDLQEGRVVRR